MVRVPAVTVNFFDFFLQTSQFNSLNRMKNNQLSFLLAFWQLASLTVTSIRGVGRHFSVLRSAI